MKVAAVEPFGVYVHWPFCAQKCPYCDFNSHVRFGGWDEVRFRAAYKRELDYVAARLSPQPGGERGARRVTSIFFGGGTPSLMMPETVGTILDHIGKLWPIEKNCEITLEANPGSVEAGRFRGYRDAGVNRVSMGLQSLRDSELKKLGRIHTVQEAKTALAIAKSVFERFSFDLIYARPGQTPEAWRTELTEALDLAGDHISLYQLTIEPDTPFAALHAAGKLIVPDADAARELYEVTAEMTGARGLAAYEISNHAKPGAESRHNLLYWRYGEYAGIGPGAHGRLLVADHSSDGRQSKPARLATVGEKNPEAWAACVETHGHGFVEQTLLTTAEQADEMLLMGLRLAEGLPLDSLRELAGVTPSAAAISDLTALNLLERIGDGEIRDIGKSNWRNNELDPIPHCIGPGLAPDILLTGGPRIRATPQGRFVLNAIVATLSKSFESARDSGTMDNRSGAH